MKNFKKGFTLIELLVVIGILWIPLIRSISPHLFIYLQSLQAYISPPIAAVFLFGILWKRANGKAAFSALIIGAAFGAFRLVLEIILKTGIWDSAFLRW